ncbi:MAG: gamma-glutamyl-gamma-aminobutyrate hydrolase family protein [Anaerolineales bacterium]|nr:gamma-glutamyl-gamma-aminobutyrate hydrolase family protein [Anaerolineales bacterium]
MILFVDNEHKLGYEKPWGEMLQAARTRIKYRLEDITGDICLMVRYPHATPELVAKYEIRAVFISGNSTDHTLYEENDKVGIRTILREKKLPVFGFCGGFQLMGETYGVPLERIGPLDPGEEDPFPEGSAPGMKKEFGYAPVNLVKQHPILTGIEAAPIVRHAHSWELKAVPEGFDVYACTQTTPIQMIIHRELPLVGTQFHPEYYTDEHPAGRIMIENFCQVAGLIQ